MHNIDITTTRSAQENLQLVIRGQRESHRLFIVMSTALYQIKAHKQWKTLGFKNIESFLDAQDVNISKSQFHDMANLGNALLWISTTEEELIKCGYSSCKEIARLAKSKGDAELNKEIIASLITRRAKGTIDNSRVRDEVVAALGLDKPKVEKSAPPAQNLDSTPADDSDDDDTTESATDWRKELLTELARAVAKGKDRADAAALILDILAGE
jgi:hypothetical protein